MIQRQSHDSLVEGLIDYLKSKGLQVVLANFQGYEKPFLIKRHSPDVLAKDPSSGLVYIGVVKLCTSLEEKITQEKFQDFSKRLMKSSGGEKIRVPLVIAVPKDCQSKVREVFKQSQIPWKENIDVIGI